MNQGHNSVTEPNNVRTITIQHSNSTSNKNTNSNSEGSSPSQETSTSTTSTTYTLRSLTSETEVDPTWSSFCRDCFRDKKPSPPTAEYFARHYFHDPVRDVRFIRVLTTNNDSNNDSSTEGDVIASTVRVFRRRISTGGDTPSTLSAGGIGEVCTAHSHRRRGLTGILLRDALDLMTKTTGGGDGGGVDDGSGMDCSLLHAAPAFQPFYQRTAGYIPIVSHWSILPLDLHSLSLFHNNDTDDERRPNGPHQTPTRPKTCVRRAEFPSDTIALQRIHTLYSEHRFVGCIVRTREYWNEYLAREIGDSLWVLTVVQNNDGGDGDDGRKEEEEEGRRGEEDTNVIVAWISIRDRGERYQLRDFGVDTVLSEQKGLTTSYLMGKLLQAAMGPLRPSTTDVVSGSTDSLRLHLPTPILNELGVWSTSVGGDGDGGDGDWNPDGFTHNDNNWIDRNGVVVEENDNRWMYRFFTDEKEGREEGDDGSSMVLNRWKRKEHLIWPADSF